MLSIYCFHKCHIPLTVLWPSLETEDGSCKLKMLQKMKQFPNWSPRLARNCKMFSWDTEGVGWWCINHFPCFWLTKAVNVKNITKYLMWKSRTKNESCSRYENVTWLPLWEVVSFSLCVKGTHMHKQHEGLWDRLVKFYCCCNAKLQEKEHGPLWH